jgi:hypothetical protein
LFRAGIVPDEDTRQRAHPSLTQILEAADRHARELGVTAEETNAAVEEAMRLIRARCRFLSALRALRVSRPGDSLSLLWRGVLRLEYLL